MSAPENVGQPRPIEFAAGVEQRAKPVVADEGRPVRGKGGRAETMIGVTMGQDHMADRLVRALRDLGAQPLTIRETPAGVGDEHAVAADDEADIGDAVVVLRRRLLMRAAADEDAGPDLFHREGPGRVRERRQAAQAEAAEHQLTPRRKKSALIPAATPDSAVGMCRHAPSFLLPRRNLGADFASVKQWSGRVGVSAVLPEPTPAGCVRRSRPAPQRAAPAAAGGGGGERAVIPQLVLEPRA